MATLTPIPGDDLRVGDVYLPKTSRRMVVERITIETRPGYATRPMFIAEGLTTGISEGRALPWTETYFGDDWVAVER